MCVWSIANGTETKPMTPTFAQIKIRGIAIPIIWVDNINNWEEWKTLSMINNCLENKMVSHVQSRSMSRIQVNCLSHKICFKR